MQPHATVGTPADPALHPFPHGHLEPGRRQPRFADRRALGFRTLVETLTELIDGLHTGASER